MRVKIDLRERDKSIDEITRCATPARVNGEKIYPQVLSSTCANPPQVFGVLDRLTL
jgi:hypothetical protein